MKKVLNILIMLIIIYFSIGWVIRGIQLLVFDSNTYLSFVRPILYWTKYLAVAFILVVLFNKYVTLTTVGKIMTYSALIIIPIAFLTASLWFNAVSEEEIVKRRGLSHTVYTWEEVESVSTEIYRESNIGSSTRDKSRRSRLIVKYNIHVEDGSVLNVWNDIETMYELHQFVLENNIAVDYLSNRENFDRRYRSVFRDSIDKAHVVFGVTTK